MLGKDLTIDNAKRQLDFILKRIYGANSTNVNGDTSVVYEGYIYPQVRQYLESQDMVVIPVNLEQLIAKAGGKPVNLIHPSEDIKLSNDELERLKLGQATNAKDRINELIDLIEAQ